MADTGAPWNLPYPLDTDLVKDGAEAIEDLALAVDAGLDATKDGGNITTGTVAAARIANLDTSKITTGTFISARLSGSYTGITGTGALNAGSITSGFGSINNGSSSITTTGAISGGTFTGNGASLTNLTADYRNNSTASTVTLDFDLGDEIVRSTRAGTLTFAGSNYRAGVSKTVIWDGGASNRSIVWPSDWVFVTVKPTILAANTRAVAVIRSHGTSASDITVEWISEAEAGFVMYFAANAAPAGWLKANGAAVSRTTYDRLFAAIGTTFGSGNGSTTFNLPDLRGEFLRAWDDSRGIDSGRVFGSAQSDAVKNHVHTYTIQDAGSGNDVPLSATVNAGTTRTGTTNNNTGGAAENRPRNIALLACIKF